MSYVNGAKHHSHRGGVVKLLLEREDVNPDSLDEVGRTPLSYAAGNGHEGVVELLLVRAGRCQSIIQNRAKNAPVCCLEGASGVSKS